MRDLTIIQAAAMLVLLAIGSWIAIHIFALLGVFIAFAYPIWWILIPKKTVCFYCQSRDPGEICFACKKEVPDNSIRYVRNFRSMFMNATLLLIISLVSFGVVLAESKLLTSTGVIPLERTASFEIPTEGQYFINEIFPMNIDVSGIEHPINAVQADIQFDPKVLQVYEIIKDASFAEVFIQEEVNNNVGFVRLTGGLPNPGFSGESGRFATILFQSVAQGVADVEFLPSSMVLANDGKGTNILKNYIRESYLIIPEVMDREQAEQKIKEEYQRNVLGSQSDSPKLVMYEESTIETSDFVPEAAPSQVQSKNTAFKVLHQIDKAIIGVWSGIVNTITGIFSS